MTMTMSMRPNTMRREIRRVIVYSLMRLMITIRDRRGASQQAFRRMMTGIVVWPLVVFLTIVAFGLLHDMIWSGAHAPVERVASVYIPPPPSQAPATASAPPASPPVAPNIGAANAIIEWMVISIVPMVIALFVIVLGGILIVGHGTWTGLAAMTIAVIVMSQYQTIASLFLAPEQIAHEIAREQTVSQKQGQNDVGIGWLVPVIAATR